MSSCDIHVPPVHILILLSMLVNMLVVGLMLIEKVNVSVHG
jgi:hypothetical protein